MFYISEKNWNKVLGYADEAYSKHKSEIGGMSVMVEDKEGDWELQEPVILKQEISSGNTILDKDALAIYYTKQAKKMGKKNYRFCWWHSHHTMKAFWSGTDITAIEECSDGDFSFALVVNLKGEYKFRVSVWKPVEAHQDIDLQVLRPKRCTKNMSKEVEELCSTRSTFINNWKKKDYNYNYGYGYRSLDQMNKSDEGENIRQERLPFHTETNPSDLFGSKMSLTELIEEIDDLCTEVVEGTIDYKEYSNQITILNKELTKESSLYRVTLIPENALSELITMLPSQLVIYDGTKEEVYDASFYGTY